MIRIIHLSDFHLENERPSGFKKEIIDAFVKDLRAYLNDNTILAFTGDLIDKGGKEFSDSVNPFTETNRILFTEILQCYPQLKGRIFIVPGNHDVQRSKIDQVEDIGLQGIIDKDFGSIDAIIEANRAGQKYLARITDYKDFEHIFYKEYGDKQLSFFENSFKLKINGYSVGVSCFNSAWLCKDNDDAGKLVVGRKQVENSLEFIKDCTIKISLCHHPLEFLNKADRDQIRPLIFREYDALFTGHVHELDSTNAQTLHGKLFISVANSTIGDNPKERKHVNGYTIIDLFSNEKISAEYRKYLEDYQKFVANTDIGTEDGKQSYYILSELERNERATVDAIIQDIGATKVEQLDQDLIIHNTDSKFPRGIKQIFVQPTLSTIPAGTIEDEDDEEQLVKNFAIEDILVSSGNYLIYGSKESGKTILLDKLLIDSLTIFERTRRIPVLFRFTDTGNQKIETVIKDFIHKSSEETKKLLTSQPFILIIDDLRFDSKYESKLNELKRFIADHPNVRIVASATRTGEGLMPVDYLAHNNVFQFQQAFIQGFNTSQIKEFIRRWMPGDEYEYQENLEKLFKNFIELSLPRTPLTVTLFLWIIERQERRPINNSTLVEMFVENLLEKANFENVYRETFDFHNKQRLLAFVAKWMLDQGESDNSYAIPYSDLLKQMTNYLKGRFDGKAQSILDNIVTRGILIECDGDKVRFKSAFLFSYFLARYIDVDAEFRKFVMDEDQYLNFVDEIDYYTGLKRDAAGILEFTQRKLIEAFGEMNDHIRSHPEEIESYFETKDLMSAEFELSDLHYKPSEKQIDSAYDHGIESLQVQSSIPQKKVLTKEEREDYGKLLRLAAAVLRNSEEIDDERMKRQAYDNVILSSLTFLIVARQSMLEYFSEHKKQPDFLPKKLDFNVFIRLLPIIHQVTMFNWLGSAKLKPTIKARIEDDRNTANVIGIEQFFSVFIYSDLRGSDHSDIVKKFAHDSHQRYLQDIIFVKLITYYFLRSKDPKMDHYYLGLLAELKVKLGQITKDEKSQFMLKMEREKNQKVIS